MRNRVGPIARTLILSYLVAGCSRAPSFSIVGSFFPVWMICLIAGVVMAFLVRAVLLRRELEHEVGPLWLFYPATVILTACALWLILFR